MAVVAELPEGAVSASHSISTQIDVLVDGVVEETITEGIDGSVTFDSGADARARLSLTVVSEDLIPVDEDSLLNVYGTELAVYRGIDDDLVALGVFGIDRSTPSDGPGGVSIAVSGRDRAGRFMAPEGSFEAAGTIAAATEAGQAILDVLLASWPTMPYDADAFAGVTVPLPELGYEEGENRWGLGSGIATAVGAELYFDRAGELTIAPVPSLTGADPVATIAEGEGGTLLEISRDWDRSGVINRWTVRGQNPSNDTAAAVPRGVAVDDNPLSPTYYYGSFGKRLDWSDNSFIATPEQAADMAAGLLAKTIGRPDSISFGAIADPARSPSDVVYIERSVLGVAAAHILDSVDIPLSGGEMSAQTRITQALE